MESIKPIWCIIFCTVATQACAGLAAMVNKDCKLQWGLSQVYFSFNFIVLLLHTFRKKEKFSMLMKFILQSVLVEYK